jgi:calpain-7
MAASAKASSSTERSRLRGKCHGLITYAERLKIGRPSPTLSKCHVRRLPAEEQTILLHASRLHGSVFIPWESEPDYGQFESLYS